jgi:N-acetyl-anhydromuramyl-L-alanine amidase AmpD
MKRIINSIVIHCAATPNGKPFTIADIDGMHKLRGFKRDKQAARNLNPELKYVGYHFVIETDGSIKSGRGLEEIGAHVQGSNAKSIGICMIGTDKFTRAQWMALRECLINMASKILGRTIMTADSMLQSFKDVGISIKGHRDYSPDLNGNGKIERNEWTKICPGFDVATWVRDGLMPLEGALYV